MEVMKRMKENFFKLINIFYLLQLLLICPLFSYNTLTLWIIIIRPVGDSYLLVFSVCFHAQPSKGWGW